MLVLVTYFDLTFASQFDLRTKVILRPCTKPQFDIKVSVDRSYFDLDLALWSKFELNTKVIFDHPSLKLKSHFNFDIHILVD